MEFGFIDNNLCNNTEEILGIMQSGPKIQKAKMADSALSRSIKKDVVSLSKTSCTDGKDDGKISFKEKITNFGKGIIAPIKTMFATPKNMIITGLSIAGCSALIAVTGGAAAPILVAAGIGGGLFQIGKGIKNQINATTDEEAKKAWQQMGTGTMITTTSALGSKAALKRANINTENMSLGHAIIKCFTSIPKNIKNSFQNASANINAYAIQVKNAKNNAQANDVPSESAPAAENAPEVTEGGTTPEGTKAPSKAKTFFKNLKKRFNDIKEKKFSKGESTKGVEKPETPKSSGTDAKPTETPVVETINPTPAETPVAGTSETTPVKAPAAKVGEQVPAEVPAVETGNSTPIEPPVLETGDVIQTEVPAIDTSNATPAVEKTGIKGFLSKLVNLKVFGL